MGAGLVETSLANEPGCGSCKNRINVVRTTSVKRVRSLGSSTKLGFRTWGRSSKVVLLLVGLDQSPLPRLEFAGALFYTTSRGDCRQAILKDDVDQ